MEQFTKEEIAFMRESIRMHRRAFDHPLAPQDRQAEVFRLFDAVAPKLARIERDAT